MTKHKEIIQDLRAEGFDDKQIIDAMEDGEYLGKAGIDQETAEAIHGELTTSQAAAIMGRKGGKATGGKKAAASRENGKKGGRPKIQCCKNCRHWVDATAECDVQLRDVVNGFDPIKTMDQALDGNANMPNDCEEYQA